MHSVFMDPIGRRGRRSKPESRLSRQAKPSGRRPFTAVLLLFCALLLAAPAARAGSNATLSTTASQTIKGWGLYPNDNLIYQSTNVQNAVYATGNNYARFRIPPAAGNSDGTINSAALVPIIQGIQLAQHYGCNHYLLSIWSPPAGMKTPVQTTTGTANGQSSGTPENLAAGSEGAFVQYIINVLRWMRGSVRLPDAISIQNEPDTHPTWDGCEYSTTSATQALWRQAVKDLRTSLNTYNMSSVQIVGPECFSTGGATTFLGSGFSNLSSDSSLNSALGAYATHTYDLTSWLNYLGGIQAHPKDAWQTEFCVQNQPDAIGATLYALRRMMSDVVDMPNNYWFWWLGWQTSASYTGQELVRTASDGAGSWTGSQIYYILKQLWTSVPAPCSLYKLTTDDPDLKTAAGNQGPWVDIAAFENSSNLAILVANPTGTSKTFDFHQCNLGIKACYYRTDASGNVTWQGALPITPTHDVTNVPVPANSVTLVVCSSIYTYEDWRGQEFSPAQAADPNISGPLADPDHDGVPNLVEYAMGGNPLAADPSAASLQPFALPPDGFGVTFRLRANLGDVGCAFQWSTNLTQWSTVAPSTLTGLSTNAGIGLWQAVFPRPVAPAFLRLAFSGP